MFQDLKFCNKIMRQALKMAETAFLREEVPVGAVVVDFDGKILARASNRTEELGCQLGHAEIQAIKRACKKKNNWRLDGCWLFVTLQPCMMCLGLISLSRITGVYYGATSNLFGFEMPKLSSESVYGNLKIISGLQEQQAAAILKKFFVRARQSSKQK